MCPRIYHQFSVLCPQVKVHISVLQLALMILFYVIFVHQNTGRRLISTIYVNANVKHPDSEDVGNVKPETEQNTQ